MASKIKFSLPLSELSDDLLAQVIYNHEQSLEVERRWLASNPAAPSYYQHRIDQLQATLSDAQVEQAHRAETH